MKLKRTTACIAAATFTLMTLVPPWVVPAVAQDQARPEDIDRSFQEVRELIRAGQHEAAIEAAQNAKLAVEAGPADPERLVQAHLLVAFSYVNYGNFQANERRPMAAETLYKEARTAIEAGLAVPLLRTTQLDPAEYPPEMIDLFERVRAEKFGGLRIIALDPPDAQVTLDGTPLQPLAGEASLGDAAVPIGSHTITVERDGYTMQTETITIAPNSWQERPYRLTKKRGKGFYGLLAAGAALVVGGIFAIVSGTDTDPPPPAPLPGPPDPPAR
jgi:hypothetical protein